MEDGIKKIKFLGFSDRLLGFNTCTAAGGTHYAKRLSLFVDSTLGFSKDQQVLDQGYEVGEH